MSSQPINNSNNQGFMVYQGGFQIIQVAVLLKQASGIFGKLRHGEVLEGDDQDGYKVVNSEEFAELIQQSKALVNYTDCFVLKNPSDKRTEIYGIMDNPERMDEYDALRYVTGILDTIVSTLPKRKIPEKLTSSKQKGAICAAIWHYRDLIEIQKDRDRAREEKSEADIGRKRAKMADREVRHRAGGS
jgi:hypothetical protein